MVIKTKLIKNDSSLLDFFFNSLEGSNYSLWFELQSFSYEDNDSFNLSNLKIIFPNAQDENSEDFLLLTPDKFFEILRRHFTLTSDGNGDVVFQITKN